MTLVTNNLAIKYSHKEVYRNESSFRLSVVSSISIEDIETLIETDFVDSIKTIAMEALISEYTLKYPGFKYRINSRRGIEKDTRVLSITTLDPKPYVKDVSIEFVFSFKSQEDKS